VRRRAQLAAARLYLVTGCTPRHHALTDLLSAAVAGGVEVVQLREKHASEEQLLAAAVAARECCARLGALLIVNDSPSVALAAGADGVHVGQEDMPVEQARAVVGRDLLLGLSTHAPAEIDAVDPRLVDYIGVGPVHETPTKPGRPAVGTALVAYAAGHAPVPFCAIGGLGRGNLGETLAAGATRVCVLRAISDAEDPQAAARELAAMVRAGAPEGS